MGGNSRREREKRGSDEQDVHMEKRRGVNRAQTADRGEQVTELKRHMTI